MFEYIIRSDFLNAYIMCLVPKGSKVKNIVVGRKEITTMNIHLQTFLKGLKNSETILTQTKKM